MEKIHKLIYPALAAAIMLTPAAALADADDNAAALDSLGNEVQLPFRTASPDDIFGGVSQVNMVDLQKKSYTTYSLANMQSLVAGYNGQLWNMGDALVLVDGVPRDADNIIPAEIETISFLKGAQAVVLYGSAASKGAILITTKRGRTTGLQVSVRGDATLFVPKAYPKYLGAAEYMTLYNEARVNDGLGILYSPEEIYKTASHANPFRYPDVDMYSGKYLKKSYNRTDADVEISGGNQRARFYTNINYYRVGDYIDFGEAKKNFTDRFSVRGNVDVNITDWIKTTVDAAATFYNARGAHSNDTGDYWANAAVFRPNRITPLIPVDMINPGASEALGLVGSSGNLRDGMFPAGTTVDATNIFADYYFKGYNKFTSRQFQFDAALDIDLYKLTKGLSFHTQFAVDYATSYNTGYFNSYATFVPTWSDYNGVDEIVSIRQEGKDEHSGVQNISDSKSNQTIHFSANFDYARTWNGVHNFHALAGVNGWQKTFSGTYHRTSNANLGVEVDYNFDNRYYVDFSLAGVHSSKLAPGHRQAWSPSGTIGWRISQEDFLKDSPVVNELMLSASASKLHQDIDIKDYYMYSANYSESGWYSWAAGGQGAFNPRRGSNTDLTYITREEFSVNLRGEFFDRMLGLTASFFTIKNDGLIIDNSTKFPSYFMTYYPESSFVPYLNYNANRRTGFDFGVKFNKQFGEFELGVGVNGTYYDTKATKRDEVWAEDYLYREGRPVDGIWGYVSDGFFATDEEAAAVDQKALGGSDLKAGDIRYVDVNNDGIIDTKDQVFLGRGGWYGDPFTMGVNITAKYKGFTLFVHGTGGFGAKGMKDNSYWWVSGDGKYSAVVRDRWTPETAATASYPRLTTTNGANNFTSSDFWIYSRDRFELAKVQLTYDFPTHLFHGPVVKGLSLYVSGDNLLMISKNRKIMEMNVGSAPQSRFYNVGATVTF